jgi:hypothetical protein
MGTYYYVRFAQTYGQGSYNTCVYNDTTSCQTSGGGSTGGNTGSNTSGGSNNDGLSNTGLMILIVVSVACLIAFAALIIRFWRRPRRELAQAVVPNEEDDTQSRPNAE